MNIAFYKPYGVLSSFTHEAENERDSAKRTLSEFGMPAGIYAAGRLDYDSEGLLILSDDGSLIHRLTDPRFKLPKTYYVLVEGVPTPAALDALRAGIPLKGVQTQPCDADVLMPEPQLPAREKPVTPHGPTTWLKIVLREGRKRQVRHMTAYVGLPTLRLVRVAIGPVSLAELRPGQWRRLTAGETRLLTARQ